MNNDSSRIRQNIKKRLPSHIDLDKYVEHMIYMDYIMFMERLAEEACKSAQKKKQTKITVDEIMDVTEDVLQEFRG
ncbi:hypothetical protein BDA99DRAFT_495899 [Phascolomyces articulosus]|uniref:Transcription factor CBF/NF-Y/archaeal histone domain-containing protein n=1 Tax=Phascolomyces articulosus TaxID=60185 RepID=A0AAD5PJ16_9FUNG|nr:hypothetical protein BDA99DRAFT_495899 [Phascolomyces articulosus]